MAVGTAGVPRSDCVFLSRREAPAVPYQLVQQIPQPDLHLPARQQTRVVDERLRRAGEVEHRRAGPVRSEEHTSELQSLAYLVCRLLLEKKNIVLTVIIAGGRRPDY